MGSFYVISFKVFDRFVFADVVQFPEGFPEQLIPLWRTLDSKRAGISSYRAVTKHKVLSKSGGYKVVSAHEWWKKGRFRKETSSTLQNGSPDAFEVIFVFDGLYQWMFSPEMPNLVTRYDLKSVRERFHDQRTMQDLVKMIQVPTLEYTGNQDYRGKPVHAFKARVLPGGYQDLYALESDVIEFSVYEESGLLAHYTVYDTSSSIVQDFEFEELELNIEIDEQLFVFEPPPDAKIQDWTTEKTARESLRI